MQYLSFYLAACIITFLKCVHLKYKFTKLFMITKDTDTKENKIAIWFSSILRWSLGLFFIIMGFIHSKEDGAWVTQVFGLVILITGFLRPKCCIQDNCKN